MTVPWKSRPARLMPLRMSSRQDGVGLAVSAPVEARTLGFPRGGFDWADAAEGCELGLAAEAFGVATRCWQ